MLKSGIKGRVLFVFNWFFLWMSKMPFCHTQKILFYICNFYGCQKCHFVALKNVFFIFLYFLKKKSNLEKSYFGVTE